ncbi:MAG: DUF1549 domain-containing protein [Verrucomicrobia bacterium]|nr:DUF1549 domain-containing protein [Verrucomicrobiota bacterium]
MHPDAEHCDLPRFWSAASGFDALLGMLSFQSFGRRLIAFICLFSLSLASAFASDQPDRQDLNDWWSLAPLSLPQIPALSDEDSLWVRTPVDAFILAKLREEGLSPSAEADRKTLIRRLFFDVIGLPPSPAEIEQFVTDPNPKAYERLVDRLLNTPRYGERWARYWLDVVHYGDTHGYDKDKLRLNAWPYRDYVIRSFNSDKPYSRFVCEQIAGDTLFPGSEDGIIATGFIAAGPWDFVAQAEVPETKIDGKVARHLDRDDMVATTMNTFVSMTVQCAQCHDHKFDPISQEDYYGLQAVFAALDRADRPYDLDPEVMLLQKTFAQRRNRLASRKSSLEKQIAELGGAALVEMNQKIEAVRKLEKSGAHAEFGYHSQIETDQNAAKWVQVDLGRAVRISRLVFVGCYDDFNGIGAGFGFPVRFKIEVSNDGDFAQRANRVLDHTGADVTNPLTEPQTVELGGVEARFVRVTATKLALRKDDFIFAVGELSVIDENGKNAALNAPVTALDSIETPPRWQRKNLVDGIFYGAGKEADATELARLTEEKRALLNRVVGGVVLDELDQVKSEVNRVDKEIEELPKGKMVYAGTVHYGSGNFRGTGADDGKPREIRLLYRGNVLTPGPVVGPGTLAVVKDLPSRFEACADKPEEERRKALAQWIVDPRNPLTWRSIVNRIWLYHFGRGIVDSPNDFGRMGQLPTHPELLDWLAAEFRDNGQSIKNLHRLMLYSATYRQVSASDPDRTALDSGDRYLARMERKRLDAEAVRDSVLWVSDALDQRMYGPGFQDFVIEKPEHSPHYEYHLHDPNDLRSHRRSIYRFLVRSQQQPFMTALDCADPSMQVDKRSETYTALQAMALMNDKFMIAMSERFAEYLIRSHRDLVDQVPAGFERVTGRKPDEDESRALVGYARTHGLKNLCRVLFNLNEFVFVD